jgi:anti-anti-sigma regulatory factor
MRIFQERRGSYLVLTFEGRLDLLTAPAVHRRLLVMLAEYQQGMVCDMGRLQVTEPLTLSLFRGVGVQAMYWPGTPVVLCCVDAEVSTWLHRLGVDRVAPVRTSLAAAMSAPRYHTPVTGDVLRLPPAGTAAQAAREFVREGCVGYSEESVETAVLLVNEMVTHALDDARTELCVLLSLRGPAIRIAVTDDNPKRLSTLPRSASPEWGLDIRLLESLAERWGALPTGSGTLVWCLLQD